MSRKVPGYITEFENAVIRFKKRVKDGIILRATQPKLKILLKTGRGNCVAFASLFRKILMKYEPMRVHRWVIGVFDKREEFDHVATLVFEDHEKIWFQSNDTVRLFRSEEQILKFAREEQGWTNKQGFWHLAYEVNLC